MWIDAKHGEMAFLIGEEKVMFDFHQSILLTDEETRACMKIESSFSPIKEHAPLFLQDDTLEGFGLEANSLSTKELAFELTLHSTKVEKLILTSNEDEKRIVATMDERPTKRSRTSPKSLTRL